MICAELLDRRGGVLQRLRIERWPLTVGRAIDNDLVVDDPYVAAYHLEVDADGDAFAVRDRGSVNGMRIDGRPLPRARVAPGQRIDFGHSHLRLRSDREALAPERPLARHRLEHPAVVLALFAAVVALLILGLYAMTSEDADWAQIGLASSALLGLMAAWAGAWALLGRLLAGRARFAWHLGIVLTAFLASEVVSLVLDLAGFGLAWRALGTQGAYVFAAALGWVFWQHLAAVHLRARLRAGVAGVIVAAVLGASWLAERAGEPEDEPGGVETVDLSLPVVRLKPTVSPDAFFGAAAALERELGRRLKTNARPR